MSENYYMLIDSGPWAGPTINVISSPDIDIYSGKIIEPPSESVKLELIIENGVDPKEFPPLDYQSGANHLLFSEKMVSCIQKAKIENIQFLDVETTYAPTNEKVAYNIANIIGVIDAVDMDQSKPILSSSGILLGFDSIVIDPDKTNSYDIFRLFPRLEIVVVSQRFKNTVEECGLTGLSFVEDKVWDGTMQA